MVDLPSPQLLPPDSRSPGAGGDDAVQQEREAYAGQKSLWPRAARPSPRCSAISMAGIISDQTEAAIITPEAKPNSSRCRPGFTALQEEHKTGAQRGAEEWYQYAYGGLGVCSRCSPPFDRIISWGPKGTTEEYLFS